MAVLGGLRFLMSEAPLQWLRVGHSRPQCPRYAPVQCAPLLSDVSWGSQSVRLRPCLGRRVSLEKNQASRALDAPLDHALEAPRLHGGAPHQHHTLKGYLVKSELSACEDLALEIRHWISLQVGGC